jgi:radical SAM protein with 4Fe4S-binding SPASM domain
MTMGYNIIDDILFSEPLHVIERKLRSSRKDSFDPEDRIVITQDTPDTYAYIDAAGIKLIDIQKIINSVDISNCFVLLKTTNPEIKAEIDFVTKFYSSDPTPINFLITDGDYTKKIIKYSNTACKKMWNHLYIGTDGNINPCCLADHRFPLGNINQDSIDNILQSDKAIKIRNWMAQGYRSIACETCYSKEDRNIDSARQPCNASTEIFAIDSLDIRIDNICNFKCRMCSEYFSSAIQQETIELYGKNAILGIEQNTLTRFSKTEKNFFLHKVAPYLTNSLKKIYFAGGEPLIADAHYQLLDRLLEIDNTNLKISYSTNLSKLKYKNLDAIEYWNQFKNVVVNASIDASGKVAEYVRHGTVWQDILDNIDHIKKHSPQVHLKIASTVGFLNVTNLIELQTQWIRHAIFDKDDLTVNVLTDPVFLSVAALPRHHKEKLFLSIAQHIDWLGPSNLAYQWQNVIKFMNNNDYTYTLGDFKSRTKILDSHRGESFTQIFPEFQDLC